MAAVSDAVQDLTTCLDGLCDADPAQLADPEAIQGLHRQLERLAAMTARADAAFDAERAWEADGARSAAAWLAVRCHLPMATARRGVQLGRALRHMAAVERAWLAGDIGEAHGRGGVRRRSGPHPGPAPGRRAGRHGPAGRVGSHRLPAA